MVNKNEYSDCVHVGLTISNWSLQMFSGTAVQSVHGSGAPATTTVTLIFSQIRWDSYEVASIAVISFLSRGKNRLCGMFWTSIQNFLGTPLQMSKKKCE